MLFEQVAQGELELVGAAPFRPRAEQLALEQFNLTGVVHQAALKRQNHGLERDDEAPLRLDERPALGEFSRERFRVNRGTCGFSHVTLLDER